LMRITVGTVSSYRCGGRRDTADAMYDELVGL
jgi:hypothetical protein